MDNSYRFFNNHDCKYMPCHKDIAPKDLNCLFCFCPMNHFEDCPGNPRFITKDDGRVIKDCSYCDFPHRAENYEAIMEFLKKKL